MKIILSVYTLSDIEGNIFYVGCSSDLKKRLKAHITEAKGDHCYTNRKKNAKIRSLNYQILIKEIDRLEAKNYQINLAKYEGRDIEYKRIVEYHRMGFNLVNDYDLPKALKKYPS